MTKVRMFDIIWDTEDTLEDEMVDLPCEVEAEFQDKYAKDEDTLLNYLSDTYGYCVYQFDYEILPE